MRFGGPVEIPEDDEVVASFGVYFSHSLANNAHVFQYPLRRKQRPYEGNDVRLFCTSGTLTSVDGSEASKGGVIASSSRLTMRCSLDTFGTNYFRSPRDESENTSTSPHHTYEYSLQSLPFQPRSDYVIGRVHNGGIHLTPVSTVQQFTSTVGDGGDRSSYSGPTRVDESFCSTQTAPIIPGLSGSDRIQRELLRQRSATLNNDADTAKELSFFSTGSVESKALRKRLVSASIEAAHGVHAATKRQGAIENALFPPEILTSGGIIGGEDIGSYSIIRRFADRYTVVEQVQQLMNRCHVLPLQLLSENVTVPHLESTAASGGAPLDKVPDEQLIEVLRGCATYMHGVWVSRQCDHFKGHIAALREVIIAQFAHSADGSVSRAQLNHLIPSSTLRRSIKDILETISTLNTEESDPTKRAWRLRYVSPLERERAEAMQAFRSRFASEETAQREAWRSRYPQIVSHIPYINARRVPPTLLLPACPMAGRLAGAAGVYDGLARGGPLLLPGSSGTVPASAQGGSGGAAAAAPSVTEADVALVRQFIRTLFAEHGVLNKMRAKQLVLRERDTHFPQVPRDALRIALQSSVREFTKLTWVLQTLGEPLVDRHRPVILGVILQLQAFEMRAVLARLGDGEGAIPAPIVQRVVSEVAEFRPAERLWYIKVGEVPNADA